jgi:hypothetical protein
MKKEVKPPVAILGAFWSYVIYCTIDGTWYLKEIKDETRRH